MSTKQEIEDGKSGRGTGHLTPSPPDTELPPLTEDPAPLTNRFLDRGPIIGKGLTQLSRWSGRFILIAIAAAILLWLLAQVWVGLLPVMLAIIVCTVLYPPVGFLTRHRWPPALAAITVMLGTLVVVGGVFAALAPSVISQSRDVIDQATAGLNQVRDWLAGPPLNIDSGQIEDGLTQAWSAIQERAGDIAGGVFSGLSVVGSIAVTGALTLVLTFFFLKDGPRFLPWARSVAGRNAGRHLTEALTRVWRTVSGFIRVQAIVSAVDAVFIGLGLWALQVPLAFALAVLTFFAGFIPIVGAISAGTLAVLVALVAVNWQTALAVLGLIIAVQQLEGNILQPWLQGRSMELHAGIILLAVAGGGTLFGIAGAFLAVPVAASAVVVLRYISEQVDLRTGDLHPDDVPVATPEGQIVSVIGAHEHQKLAGRARAQGRSAQEQAERNQPGGKSQPTSGFVEKVKSSLGRRKDKTPPASPPPNPKRQPDPADD